MSAVPCVLHRVDDGGQRPHRIGHVVGAMRKGQQRGRHDQRHREQLLQRLLAVLQPLGLAADDRARSPAGRPHRPPARSAPPDQARCRRPSSAPSAPDRPQRPRPSRRSAPAPSAARRPILSGTSLMRGLDEGQEQRRNRPAQDWRDHPACRDLPHLAPVRPRQTLRRDAAPITPPTIEWVVETGAPSQVARFSHKRRGDQCRHHRPDEGVGVRHRLGRDDAARDRADHIAPGDQRAQRFRTPRRSPARRPWSGPWRRRPGPCCWPRRSRRCSAPCRPRTRAAATMIAVPEPCARQDEGGQPADHHEDQRDAGGHHRAARSRRSPAPAGLTRRKVLVQRLPAVDRRVRIIGHCGCLS